MKPARVVGAGLSGLAAAWCLSGAGFDVEVVEASAHPGGLIETLATRHGPVERAANAFVWTETTERWFRTIGVRPEFPLPASRRRFIFRNGRARRWPLGPIETLGMGARLGTAWARRSLSPRVDETVAAWGRRVVGRAATSALVGPGLQGIYAAPPDRLSAPVIFGERRRGRTISAAPRGGMGEFIEKLYAALVAHGVTFAFGRSIDALDPATPTVVCTNAPAAAALVKPHAPALGTAIAAVPMNQMVTATAFFEPHLDDLHGFGVLFPRDSGVQALGALFNTDIFIDRGADRSETWIYGSIDPAAPLPSDADLAARLEHDREILTGQRRSPVAVFWTRRVPALPIYSAAIDDVRRRIGDLPPWLALAGNYLGRLGVAKLLDVAADAAARLGGATSPESRARA
jgi:oxygen-dependent protoporphyrinogen oxidase